MTTSAAQPVPPIWTLDEAFLSLFDEIHPKALPSADRLHMLYQFARYANAKQGDVAEVGVYRGGTARLFARTCPGKMLHLFDTFEGMPATDQSIDVHQQGDFSDTSLAAVQAFLNDLPNVAYYPGIFPDTSGPVADRQFSLVYVDADIYKTTADCLAFFYDRIVPGGVMLFDDWDWQGCPGVKKAVLEFLQHRHEVPIVTTNYQCVLIKL